MKEIVVLGWNEGFRKIHFTTMLRSEFGYSLAEAKQACDRLLEGEHLRLLAQEREADRISSELALLGAEVFVEPMPGA